MGNNIICHEVGKDDHFKIWHALEEHMFIYTYSDGGSIVCSEKIYPIKKGTLCFIGAGKYHYTMPDSPETYDRSKLFVLPDKLKKILSLMSSENNFSNFSEGGLVYSIIDDAEREAVEHIFDELEKHRDGEYFEDIVVSSCIKLMIMISQNSTEKTANVAGALSRAIAYINSNIFRDITIDEICTAIHISKYHFCRRFRENTGMTVMTYILKTRIVLAKNLLLSEKISVSDVSNRCGFSSISYFCRVFKDETGMTPLEFRKENE